MPPYTVNIPTCRVICFPLFKLFWHLYNSEKKTAGALLVQHVCIYESTSPGLSALASRQQDAQHQRQGWRDTQVREMQTHESRCWSKINLGWSSSLTSHWASGGWSTPVQLEDSKTRGIFMCALCSVVGFQSKHLYNNESDKRNMWSRQHFGCTTVSGRREWEWIHSCLHAVRTPAASRGSKQLTWSKKHWKTKRHGIRGQWPQPAGASFEN